MACVLNAPLKKYMSCFALKMSISLKDPLKMRSGEFAAKVTRSVAFFRLFLVAPIHLSSFGLELIARQIQEYVTSGLTHLICFTSVNLT